MNTKHYLDTAPFIYWIENHPVYAEKVESYLIDTRLEGDFLVTSVLSFAEYGVMPERIGRKDLIQSFEELLEDFNFEYLEISHSIARISFQLRAKYNFLKSMDALQLAAAIKSGCATFLTNDKRLMKISELKVILLDDY